MKKPFNRFLCMVLALSLLMVPLPLAASADSTAKAELTLHIGEGLSELNGAVKLDVEDTETITATYTGDGYDDAELKWEAPQAGIINVSDESVVTDESQNSKSLTLTVEAVKTGYVFLEFTVENGELSQICPIIVSGSGGLTLKPSGEDPEFNQGEKWTFTLTPAEDIKSVEEWGSSDDDIASVYPSASSAPAEDGTFSADVTALKGGKAVITAKAKMSDGTTETAACEVTVIGSGTTTNSPIASIDIVAATTPVTIEKDEERKISAVVSPYGSTEKIIWSVDNEKVATIINDKDDPTKAIVKGIAPGVVTISAESASGKAKTPTKLTLTVSGITLSLRNPSSPIRAESTSHIIMTRYGSATENDLSSDDWNWESDTPAIANVLASGPSMGQIIARAPGSAKISCKSESGRYSAELKITVVDPTASAIKVSLSNNRINFSSLLSQLKSKCTSETGSTLNYITNISVPSEQGTLYYSYVSPDKTGSGVAAASEYYVSPATGQLDLSKITFIPQKDYSGDIMITYTGYSTTRMTYTGIISTTATATSSNRITYISSDGSPIRFQSTDFSNYCQTVNAHELNSVSFSTPSSRYGMLYYGYTSSEVTESNVASGETFYRTKSPSIDKLYFLPDDDYEGSFSISFTGKDASGATLRGSVYITVGNSSSSSSSSENSRLTYYCLPGERVYFSSSDFSNESYDTTGNQYNYVRFKQPSHGTLYHNNSSNAVYSGTNFYRTGSGNRLDEVFYEANNSYNGTVYVPFICYDTEGKNFSGNVTIRVGRYAGRDSISYSCSSGGIVHFDADDFSGLSYNRTGRQISYARFTQPPSSRGTLYYDNDRKVSSGTSFFRSNNSRLIDDVYFDANSGYRGTVSIPFTGYNTSGNSFSGTVKINVGSGSSSSSSSSSDTADTSTYMTVTYESNGTGVTFRPSDFITACAAGLKTPLSYVKITELPAEEAGKLFLNYSSPINNSSFDPDLLYSVNSAPEISRIAFVPRANYEGTVSLSYVGTGTGGDTCSGNIKIQVTLPSSSAYFKDMWKATWAIPAVDFMKRYSVVEGTSSQIYSPTAPMKRGDYVLMLNRLFKFSVSNSNVFSDVPADSYYAAAVNAACSEGIIESGAYFYPNFSVTREKAAKYLYNSLNSIGLNVSPGSYSYLSRFPDAELVSSDAVEALGAMVRLGVFVGDENGKLNPTLPLSRAQLAVILYRALTFI